MRRPIVLAGRPFELVTTDWPFDDDEARCLVIAETHLRELEHVAPTQLEQSLQLLDAGPVEFELERVLVTSLVEATSDYETGQNCFECLLELRPLVDA